MLILSFLLAGDVLADPTVTGPTPVTLEAAERGTLWMQDLERKLGAMSEAELAETRNAVRALTETCPDNGASLQAMGSLIAHVPADSVTRPGIDAMARALALLELDPGAAPAKETEKRLWGVEDQVAALSPEQLAAIDAHGAEVHRHLGPHWPAKPAFDFWKEQLWAEGHGDLGLMLEIALGNTC